VALWPLLGFGGLSVSTLRQKYGPAFLTFYVLGTALIPVIVLGFKLSMISRQTVSTTKPQMNANKRRSE